MEEEVKRYTRNNQIWELVKITKDERATFYTLRDPKGNTMTYGTKVFLGLFKLIKEDNDKSISKS